MIENETVLSTGACVAFVAIVMISMNMLPDKEVAVDPLVKDEPVVTVPVDDPDDPDNPQSETLLGERIKNPHLFYPTIRIRHK